MRLNKFLSSQGLISRRNAKDWLDQNQLLINGQRVVLPGFQINPLQDKVLINGHPLLLQIKKVYYLVNKPVGYVSTTSDEKDRPIVTSLVNSKIKIYPIGRLDQDSSGLIILTNDGELTNLLTHPRFHFPKTYQALIEGYTSPMQLDKLRQKVVLKEGLTQPMEVRFLRRVNEHSLIEITLYEGKNRQIRRVCGRFNLKVLQLRRVAVGTIKIGNLGSGQSRLLSQTEVESLRNLASIASNRR